MILSDERITEFGELGMLRPFDASYVRPASYDVRLGDTIDFLTHGRSDPFTIEGWGLDYAEDSFFLKPGEFVLAETEEYLKMPSDICGMVSGRTTLAVKGIQVNAGNSFVAPGFIGKLKLTIKNISSVEVRLVPGMRIAQVVFMDVA